MLEIVSQAMRANAISAVKCFDKKKSFESEKGTLQQFRNDPTVRVLLIPLSAGAEGLDLVCASHVFLLEPLLNPYQEQQAINRVDRIGQLKNTVVHKYIVNDTVEEEVVRNQLNGQIAHMTNKTNKSTSKDDVTLTTVDIMRLLKIESDHQNNVIAVDT